MPRAAARGRKGRPKKAKAKAKPAPAPPPRQSTYGRRSTAAAAAASGSTRRGYDASAADARDSEYHYGSDFGDDDDDSAEDGRGAATPTDDDDDEEDGAVDSGTESEWSGAEKCGRGGGVESESELELGPTTSSPAPAPGPDPVWLREDVPVPELALPDSSEDLLVAAPLALRAAAVAEALRRFRHVCRLSPFRLEDLCAALACDEASSLLVEVHVALLRALLREEDAQQTHFGPVDHKDSVHLQLFLVDRLTWPEVLRAYVESDPKFERAPLDVFAGSGGSAEYPFASAESRLRVLEFLCDQFLASNPIREDLTGEDSMRYDDHCRACHRLGDLLCCETCPATYHLECVDPPLVHIPSDDWQCSLCESHSLPGVTDCISDAERQGLLSRHERLGFDRHGRKYWFVCRRIFVEAEDQSVWYYTSVAQFEELLRSLDRADLERALYEEIAEVRGEILRQMRITERITEQLKGNRKSYLETANAFIAQQRDKSQKGDDSIERGENGGDGENKEGADDEANSKMDCKILTNALEGNQRLTRLKYSELTSGTLLYKLGNEGSFKNFVNQYTVNAMALNKPQRNEERDKKRHLAHKFSVSCHHDFKWIGLLNATKTLLVNTLRATLLQLESHIAIVFMHPNWSLLRKAWIQAVQSCNVPRDFTRALVVLQACIKTVVFVPVWHEQLGHVRLQRITAAEREDRKKIEKREKKEKEEEEERNKVSFFIKYNTHSKHQIWKQKGEEYRIHGQWGWLWHSSTRRLRKLPKPRHSLSCGAVKIMVPVKVNDLNKVIAVQPKTYDYLMNEKNSSEIQDLVQNLKVVDPHLRDFEEIDVEKCLSSNNRIAYPKIAKKSRLDDLLGKRVQLKVLEEKRLGLKVKEEDDVDVENIENGEDTMASSNDTNHNRSFAKETVTTMTKEIQTLRQQYAETIQLAKGYKCYSKNCNANTANLSQGSALPIDCYSPLCIKKANMRKELLLLLSKIKNSQSMNNSSSTNLQLAVNCLPDSKDYLSDISNDIILAMNSAIKLEENSISCCIKMNFKFESELPSCGEFKSESMYEESVIPGIGNEMEVDQDVSPDNEVGELDVENSENTNEERDSEKKCKKERKYRDVSVIKDESDSCDGRPPIPKLRISTRNRKSHLTNIDVESTPKKPSYKPTYRAYINRRFCAPRGGKKEEREIKPEYGPDGSLREYSATCTAGKVYLKRIVLADAKKKKTPVKYPLCSTFHTKSKARSILVLPAHELRKLSRMGGRLQVAGFNHNSKPNPVIWPYPCSRPLFKTCWLYRTINMTSLAAVAMQLRILWTCIRWDDMSQKPSNNDGKHQITTETEIITMEMLKHRHVGQFMDKTQYLRRKVVIPLEVPKTVREVTSIRIGLRKRKRADSPQSMEPQVTEEWVDEDKLELWEIKQYGEKADRVVPITRTTTGKLPPTRNLDNKEEPVSNTPKLSSQEMKEKLEQQLRMQRAAHQQKRALEQAKQKGEESSKGNVTPAGNKAVVGTRRVFMTKGADGTTRVISHTSVMPKTPIGQSPQNNQPPAKTPNNHTPKEGLQKVQIIRGPDGKICVRGLIAGQQLIQMPDGKLQVAAPGQHGVVPPGGTVIATGGAPPTPKIAITPAPSPHSKLSPTKPIGPGNNTTTPMFPSGNKVVIRQQQPVRTITAVSSAADRPGQRIITRQPILVQGNQQVMVQSPQHVVVQGQSKVSMVQAGGVNKPPQTVVLQGANSGQMVQTKVTQLTAASPGQKLTSAQQVVVGGPGVAGKLQCATINGQQVLVRQLGNNQVVVVGQIATQSNVTVAAPNQGQESKPPVVVQVQTGANQQPQAVNKNAVVVAAGQGMVSPQRSQVSPQRPFNQVSPVKQQSGPVQVNSSPPQQQQLTDEQLLEKRLLIGQPPGTIIKTVTAQVVHLEEGPRIVLQGLQGNSLTQQQLMLVQQQVKQQLLKAQETTGKQGMLGPTKLYLAVQPSSNSNAVAISEPPPPSVASPPPPPPPPLTSPIPQESKINSSPPKQTEPIQNKSKAPMVVVNGDDPDEPPAHIINKFSKQEVTKPEIAAKPEITKPETSESETNKFVLTPDYIQQTIKNALRQENLNPEIEEKLLQLQRYQERQMRPDSGNGQQGSTPMGGSNSRNASHSSSSHARRRPASNSRHVDDDDWIETVPRKRNRPSSSHNHHERNETFDEVRNSRVEHHSSRVDHHHQRPRPSRAATQQGNAERQQQFHHHETPQPDEYRHRHPSGVSGQTRLSTLLLRQKESLKKDIIKKRGLLEKELGIEIQKELSAELALRTKTNRGKVEEVRPSFAASTPISSSRDRGVSSSHRAPPSRSHHSSSSHKKSSSSRSHKRKKEKLMCVCKTPYDDTKFYVGCEHCSNWFHGDCVGITEEMSKSLDEYVCDECRHARDTQELYCLCRQPYDNSQFYICCDRCQDWFHGRCVGILQSEADNIDEYVCPNCQKNNSVNFANMKDLKPRDFDNLKKLIKQIQSHKSAWPFMEPVNPKEAPMYYKVIKEPMDLKLIERKINEQSYNTLSEFIGDMTKIFDNCRYFNPKESLFYRNAHSLEAFFVQKIQFFREKLFETNQ